MENPAPAPIQGPRSLQLFTQMLTADPPEPEAFERIIGGLERERRLEHAWLIMRQARLDPACWGAAQARMKAVLERSRGRRMSQWQADPDRVTLRLRFALEGPACAQPSALLSVLARTLITAGLPVALGLEKSPRPAIRLGHPLPALVEGRSEWADAVLLEAAPVLVVTWGASKAEALGEIFGATRDDRRWPAQRTRRPGAAWIVDEAAADRISGVHER